MYHFLVSVQLVLLYSPLHCTHRLSTYAVKRETFPAKEESQDGHTTHHSRTLQQRAPSNLPHTSEVLPLPIQDIAPPTAPPTALPTTPPPTKPPSSVVTLKESIALVIAYQSLKEKPKGYLPTGGMIENKYLNNFCFGYSVSVCLGLPLIVDLLYMVIRCVRSNIELHQQTHVLYV